ncbi:DUF7284 family protein [Halobacterium rubrum]|uniref:DUF7284 family protein n=1 Tax=Halobacterium TaxID=2239 RepID=UPI001F2C6C54|nr:MULTISPECIES: hypothetical protein [Halobacterium]MDH5021678.1 hypothetical protein [Halobacterium rubrum]
MTRAISTVVDVSLAILLVSAAAVALVTIPSSEPEPPDPDATARTVLASTVTVDYGQTASETTSGRVSTLLAHAAVAAERDTTPGFVAAVERAVDGVVRDAGGRVEVVATAGAATLRVGTRPPPDAAAVTATTYDVDANGTTASVTVRTWSP